MNLSPRQTVLAALFAALTAVGAFIKIPLPAAPVTLQVFFVFLCGLALPPRAALLAEASYLIAGLAGMPVFAGGGGLSYALTPTFGYLLSFLFMAPAVSLLARRFLFGGKTAKFILYGALATLFCELIGIGYMAAVLFALGTPLAGEKAFYLLCVFFPLDLVKFALGVLLATALGKRVPGLFQ